MTQLPLFPEDMQPEKFEGAMLFGAIGDALGWPTEFGRYPRKVQIRDGKSYLSDFVEWSKLVGGRYWGYEDSIEPGSYSDDTQLTLCVARSLDRHGRFQPQQFAYFELPLWLHYERGGGRSIKMAARSMVRTKREWYMNFYRRKEPKRTIDYRRAGANGAAMRVLPIALANVGREDELVRSAFLNAIVTHGHPRAILGTLIYASSVAFLARERQPERIFDFARSIVQESTKHLRDLPELEPWWKEWDSSPLNGQAFRQVFALVREEAMKYLAGIDQPFEITDEDCYRLLGADRQPLKGSGLSTVLVSLYLFAKYFNRPKDGILAAVNALGSDTDTIASFLGGLFGAYFGTSVIPENWLSNIQDRRYLQQVAKILYTIATGQTPSHHLDAGVFDKQEALLRIRAWEIGLHEMFWDAISIGNRLVHPSLGPGTVEHKEERPIRREGYVAKLVKVNFACGQSCVFHSRVAADGTVSESFAKELQKSMGDMRRLW